MKSKRRAFTLVELLVTISIILILAALIIPALVANRPSTSTPVNTVPTQQVENNAGYHVHQVPLAAGLSIQSTRAREALAAWLREHPQHKLISFDCLDDGYIVIVTETR